MRLRLLAAFFVVSAVLSTNVCAQVKVQGDGIKQATERKVVFGGTDSPLKPEELAQRKLVQLPTAVGGVVPVVNLRGVGSNQLVLTGELLADWFAGKVARWNDPRIAALNPGVALPATSVQRVVWADKSGTTEGFSKYLGLMNPSFKNEVGASQLPKWPGQHLEPGRRRQLAHHPHHLRAL